MVRALKQQFLEWWMTIREILSDNRTAFPIVNLSRTIIGYKLPLLLAISCLVSIYMIRFGYVLYTYFQRCVEMGCGTEHSAARKLCKYNVHQGWAEHQRHYKWLVDCRNRLAATRPQDVAKRPTKRDMRKFVSREAHRTETSERNLTSYYHLCRGCLHINVKYLQKVYPLIKVDKNLYNCIKIIYICIKV